MAMPIIPNATLITVKQTARGRGVFPLTPLTKGTQLLSTDMIPAHVINREYRKEVCAQCFGYERGRTLKVRDSKAGVYFCGVDCQLAWRDATSPSEIAAMEAVESFIKAKSKGQQQPPSNDDFNGGFLPDVSSLRPSTEQINHAWNNVSATASFITEARSGSQARPHVRSLRAVLATSPSPDILTFLLSGILSRAQRRGAWQALKALAADTRPYATPQDLAAHVQAYLQLLAVVPAPLVPAVKAAACRTLVSRDSHNSFGIRSLDDAGAEFFGFAVWPHASFFNHACDPNVAKERVGRQWRFWLLRDVDEGTELCISYLGGEERELNVNNRRARLKNNWDFECGCDRCALESAEKDMQDLFLGE